MLFTALLLAGLFILNRANVFSGVSDGYTSLMKDLAKWGAPGMFVLAIISNVTLVLIVPYNLPFLSLVPYAKVGEMIMLGTATGIGAGIGALLSFRVALAIVARVEDLSESALFRWTKRNIDAHPKSIPFFVWLATGTVLPDSLILVPLAMINYPWHKMIIPTIVGKIFQNVLMAFVFRYAAELASRFVSENINFDITVALLIIFVMVIAYQVEKARDRRSTGELDPHARRADTQPTVDS